MEVKGAAPLLPIVNKREVRSAADTTSRQLRRRNIGENVGIPPLRLVIDI